MAHSQPNPLEVGEMSTLIEHHCKQLRLFKSKLITAAEDNSITKDNELVAHILQEPHVWDVLGSNVKQLDIHIMFNPL